MRQLIRCFSFLMLLFIIISFKTTVLAQKSDSALDLQSRSAVLIEGSTGSIIYEKNKDIKLNPASITKIMTLLLIFEDIDNNSIALKDTVTVSAHAASMGGSQVFLEENETQTLGDMIKCISIASANDACVAVAEHIAGSETEFVNRMNKRANELGMNNTHFVNCCGLDVENHYSTAMDVAIMSRELITKHPEIKKYTTTWMDTITHNTKKGSKEFGLTNTNKLVRTYTGITGLKTGSTSLAKYCLSASANRNNIDLISVVMCAPEHKLRYQEAAKLLDYGFANCTLFNSSTLDIKPDSPSVKSGAKETVKTILKKPVTYVLTSNESINDIKYDIKLNDTINAPVNKDDKLGEIIFRINKKDIGTMDIVAGESIKKLNYIDCVLKIINNFL